MKKLAFIAAALFITASVQSCRESDEVLSPQEASVLKRVQSSEQNINSRNTNDSIKGNNHSSPILNLDGEILPPPRK